MYSRTYARTYIQTHTNTCVRKYLLVLVVLHAKIREELTVLLRVAWDFIDDGPAVPGVVVEHNASAVEVRKAVHWGHRRQLVIQTRQGPHFPFADLDAKGYIEVRAKKKNTRRRSGGEWVEAFGG